jgi:hypothetical protein
MVGTGAVDGLAAHGLTEASSSGHQGCVRLTAIRFTVSAR